MPSRAGSGAVAGASCNSVPLRSQRRLPRQRARVRRACRSRPGCGSASLALRGRGRGNGIGCRSRHFASGAGRLPGATLTSRRWPTTSTRRCHPGSNRAGGVGGSLDHRHAGRNDCCDGGRRGGSVIGNRSRPSAAAAVELPGSAPAGDDRPRIWGWQLQRARELLLRGSGGIVGAASTGAVSVPCLASRSVLTTARGPSGGKILAGCR
jgi:hypothetical protein